jgi:CobQ-like glutamine amidotransferase family enzyme
MIKIGHLYPEILSHYGDNGNVTVFQKRCSWRDIPFSTHRIGLGDEVDFSKYDVVFLGGGSDHEQSIVRADLLDRRDNLKKAIEDGLVMLAIDSGFQLLGEYYQNNKKEEISGLGILDFYTKNSDGWLVNNVVAATVLGSKPYYLIGFANHTGETYLAGLNPLGQVLAGVGNNRWENLEGLHYKNLFCSYLHGPLLPNNPLLADTLIELAAQRSGNSWPIKPLPDIWEGEARIRMMRRLKVV